MNQKPPGQWSRFFERCTKCGTQERKHFSSGKCQRCYFEEYNKTNAARITKQKNDWYLRNGGASMSKDKREQFNFGGNREAALKRDGYRCVKCGSSRKLTVHHKDGLGRNVRRTEKNNAIENLETQCRACHMKEHAIQIREAKDNRLSYWAPKFKLSACLECGRTSQRHRREGFCGACWNRESKRRQQLGTLIKNKIGAPKGEWK